MEYFYKDFDERFFAGVEHEGEVTLGSSNQIQPLWRNFISQDLLDVKMKIEPNNIIGLICYSFDFKDSKLYSYYALAETIDLIDQNESIVTKKIPKGKYICFPVEFDKLEEHKLEVYEYCDNNNINLHKEFAVEEYSNSQNYYNDGAKLNFCIKIEN